MNISYSFIFFNTLITEHFVIKIIKIAEIYLNIFGVVVPAGNLVYVVC